jgi:HSP20 family protein
MDFDEWFRKRFSRSWPFPDIEELMKEMEEEMQRSFRELEPNLPKHMVRKKKMPDGTEISEFGPFIYGYSMTLGPDGKPIIREFGNVRPSGFPQSRTGFSLAGVREPLVDILDEGEVLKVIAEMPGVEKENVKVEATSDSLTISADRDGTRYYKEVELPSEVDPNSAKSTCKNGVLEVTLKKSGKKKGVPIKVE